MEIIIILILILLNGFFSLAELSLVSSKKYKLENAKEKGKSGAKDALKLIENPSGFLSAIQIGITLIGIILGFYSGDALSEKFAVLISKIDFLAPYTRQISGPLVIGIITFLSILFGEIFPKQVGMIYPEKTAMLVSKPMHWISVITSPFIWLLSQSNFFLMKLFGFNTEANNKISEEEIKSIVKESAEDGEIEDIEHDIVDRVFELGDTKARKLFTHKNQIVFLDMNDTFDDIIDKINGEHHSAYPVTEDNNPDTIKGIVIIKDLFFHNRNERFEISKYMREPVYLTESMHAYRILELFKQHKMHYGIVIDEYGNTQGMITLDDVVDALLGDMTEAGQKEYQLVKKSPVSWQVDGQFPLKDFSRILNLHVREKLLQNIQTVAGFMIILKNGQLPEVGDQLIFGNFGFKIVGKDGQRIDKILVTKK